MLILLKKSLNYPKDSISECILKEYKRLLVFEKKTFFFITYNNGKFKSCRRNRN